jgi:hypothetical protein
LSPTSATKLHMEQCWLVNVTRASMSRPRSDSSPSFLESPPQANLTALITLKYCPLKYIVGCVWELWRKWPLVKTLLLPILQEKGPWHTREINSRTIIFGYSIITKNKGLFSHGRSWICKYTWVLFNNFAQIFKLIYINECTIYDACLYELCYLNFTKDYDSSEHSV